MAEQRTQGLGRINSDGRFEQILEDPIENLDIAKGMARMAGLKYIAVDDNSEVWGYPGIPDLDETGVWQPKDNNNDEIVFICTMVKAPEDAEDELYEL